MNQAQTKRTANEILGILSEDSQEMVRMYLQDESCSSIAQLKHVPIQHVRDVVTDFYTLMLARTV